MRSRHRNRRNETTLFVAMVRVRRGDWPQLGGRLSVYGDDDCSALEHVAHEGRQLGLGFVERVFAAHTATVCSLTRLVKRGRVYQRDTELGLVGAMLWPSVPAAHGCNLSRMRPIVRLTTQADALFRDDASCAPWRRSRSQMRLDSAEFTQLATILRTMR